MKVPFVEGDRIRAKDTYVESFIGIEGTLVRSAIGWEVVDLTFIPKKWKFDFFTTDDDSLERHFENITEIYDTPLYQALR